MDCHPYIPTINCSRRSRLWCCFLLSFMRICCCYDRILIVRYMEFMRYLLISRCYCNNCCCRNGKMEGGDHAEQTQALASSECASSSSHRSHCPDTAGNDREAKRLVCRYKAPRCVSQCTMSQILTRPVTCSRTPDDFLAREFLCLSPCCTRGLECQRCSLS